MIPLQNQASSDPTVPSEYYAVTEDYADMELPLPGRTGISAVVVTNNSARNIRRTLAGLTWCDEIIVVDGYSKDETVLICKEFNCTVYKKTFEGYGLQKQYAVSKTINDWVLSIEPGEVLPEGLIFEIQRELNGNSRYAGFLIPAGLVFFNKQFLYGKESWRYRLRLFDKRSGNFTDSPVNEIIKLDGTLGKLRHRMLDHRFPNLPDWESICQQRVALESGQVTCRDYRRSRMGAILTLLLCFLKYYFLHLNFLNGVEGFFWSALNAHYQFCRRLRIRESTSLTEVFA